MTNFEEALSNCLDQVANGASLEQALALYPEYALELQPLLVTAGRLERGREVRPSEGAKARVRDRLTGHMKSHPRHAPRGASNFQRLAISFAVVLFAFFASGTAFAQRALPGEALYSWKRASENVWRAVTSDPLGTDLAISERRAFEITRVREDPERSTRAVKDYQDALNLLKAREDDQSQARVLPRLQVQQELLKTAGISVPELDDYLSTHPTGKPVGTPGNGPPQ